MRYFSGVERTTIITKRVKDWEKLKMIAQEYTCPFAAISNPIYAYNQIGQREFAIGQTMMTYVRQLMCDRNIFVSGKALKLQHLDFNCRMYV